MLLLCFVFLLMVEYSAIGSESTYATIDTSSGQHNATEMNCENVARMLCILLLCKNEGVKTSGNDKHQLQAKITVYFAAQECNKILCWHNEATFCEAILYNF